MQPDFSRVIKLIPTYNENENIVSLARAVFSLYPQTSVMVLDDNSSDGTSQAVRNLQTSFSNLHLHQRSGKRGLGKSYLEGFKKVLANERYQAIVMMDADFSHDPKEIRAMLAKLEEVDVVNGSRYVEGGGIENWRWGRRLLSRFANFYARTILKMPVRDLTNGFICLRREAIKKIDLDSISSEGYAFIVELKYRLLKAGNKFYEYPIIFSERQEGQSKMSRAVIWESVWLPWKLRFGFI